MKCLVALAAVALAACATAPAGYDSGEWRKDRRECQAEAEAASARAATFGQKRLAEIYDPAWNSGMDNNPATTRWKVRRMHECMAAKGYPTEPPTSAP